MALVITIVVMLILVGVTINFGMNAIRHTKLEDLRTSMITIQGKAKIIKEKHDFEKTELVGEEASSLPGGIPTPSGAILYKWDRAVLEGQGLRNSTSS